MIFRHITSRKLNAFTVVDVALESVRSYACPYPMVCWCLPFQTVDEPKLNFDNYVTLFNFGTSLTGSIHCPLHQTKNVKYSHLLFPFVILCSTLTAGQADLLYRILLAWFDFQRILSWVEVRTIVKLFEAETCGSDVHYACSQMQDPSYQ